MQHDEEEKSVQTDAGKHERPVLVAGLSEWFSLGEDDGHSQVLEGGDVEEGGVLVVLDVFVVVCTCYILAVR